MYLKADSWNNLHSELNYYGKIGAREALIRGILGSHSRPCWMETNKSDGSKFRGKRKLIDMFSAHRVIRVVLSYQSTATRGGKAGKALVAARTILAANTLLIL